MSCLNSINILNRNEKKDIFFSYRPFVQNEVVNYSVWSFVKQEFIDQGVMSENFNGIYHTQITAPNFYDHILFSIDKTTFNKNENNFVSFKINEVFQDGLFIIIKDMTHPIASTATILDKNFNVMEVRILTYQFKDIYYLDLSNFSEGEYFIIVNNEESFNKIKLPFTKETTTKIVGGGIGGGVRYQDNIVLPKIKIKLISKIDIKIDITIKNIKENNETIQWLYNREDW